MFRLYSQRGQLLFLNNFSTNNFNLHFMEQNINLNIDINYKIKCCYLIKTITSNGVLIHVF